MAFNPLFIIPDLFLQTNFAMAALGLKQMGKLFCEVRKKVLPSWLCQFSFAKLRQPTGQTFFPNMVLHFGVGRHASFPC